MKNKNDSTKNIKFSLTQISAWMTGKINRMTEFCVLLNAANVNSKLSKLYDTIMIYENNCKPQQLH